MLEQIRIYGKGNNSHDTCNVLISFECVDDESYCIIHRVQIEPTVNSTFLIDCPLDDNDTREHFESLLSANYHGYEVKTGVAA